MDTPNLKADRVLAESETLGEAFERLAELDDTFCLVVEADNPELYHSLPRSQTPYNEEQRRRAGDTGAEHA
jgi:hypothetical protein